MATVKNDPSNDNIVNVGSNFRIEPGPKLVTAVASEELLHDDNSANHYHAPVDNGDGTVSFAKDATGKPIILGNEMTYLDYGGNVAEPTTVFYIYQKTPVDNKSEFLPNGDANPYYVPPHVYDLQKAGERGEDRVAYDYVWAEVATRATLEAAVEFAQRKAVD